MPIYYVDDGGDGSTGASWATAYTSLSALDDAVTIVSGDIIYIGHDHVCQYTHSANRTITGPTSSPACAIISATQGSDPPVYQASTTNQIDTTEGAYQLIFDGAFSLYGVCLNLGGQLVNNGDFDEASTWENCTIKVAANSNVSLSAAAARYINCTLDCAADGTTNRSGHVVGWGATGAIEFVGVSFANVAYRTGTVFSGGSQTRIPTITGCDFSGFTNGTLCELFDVTACAGSRVVISNCLTAATWSPVNGDHTTLFDLMVTNTGPADAPTYLYHRDYTGQCVSSDAIYRAGGATVEGDAVGWLITTTSRASEYYQYKTPWIYGLVSSTGSKTFDLFITNDTGDFDDSQVWMEVEYLGTADEAQWTLAKDQRATITATAAAQTDDTASTWNGTGPNFTYKQKLSVTATVNETGQYRARVCVGLASIASSRYFYVDPKVTVS